MQYVYSPRGVCSREMQIEVEGNIIKSVKIVGGCAGNTVGVSRLVEGMDIEYEIDLSEYNNENKMYNLSNDTFCIVAVPVYGGRVPTPAVARLHNINGNGAKALLVAVYGNRAMNKKLNELSSEKNSTRSS